MSESTIKDDIAKLRRQGATMYQIVAKLLTGDYKLGDYHSGNSKIIPVEVESQNYFWGHATLTTPPEMGFDNSHLETYFNQGVNILQRFLLLHDLTDTYDDHEQRTNWGTAMQQIILQEISEEAALYFWQLFKAKRAKNKINAQVQAGLAYLYGFSDEVPSFMEALETAMAQHASIDFSSIDATTVATVDAIIIDLLKAIDKASKKRTK